MYQASLRGNSKDTFVGHEEVRIPPQNVEAEKCVLGSMLIDEEAIGLALEILDAAIEQFVSE